MGLFDKLRGKGNGQTADLKARAKESIELGRERAARILETQAAALAFRSTQDAEFAAFAEEAIRRHVFLSMEMQFLWGYFFMHVQEFDLPTNGFNRIKLHLIDWLMNERGYSFESARDNANEIEDLYNAADPLFESISALGKEAFAKHGDHYFFVILDSLRTSGGLKPELA
ncbi:MAG: hypothetical protein JNK21_06115 [Rhodospirillaceae bacterium]|nr:hypothetical protein [Rhodospirillaceae bacterium]